MTLCGIVDYGMGNLASVSGAIRHLGYRTAIFDNPAALARADIIVLPGVGAFGQAMDNLRRLGLVDALDREVNGQGKPFLGICLGMQLLAESSTEEGEHAGLGWISGRVERIVGSSSLRVPHVGWNGVSAGPAGTLFPNDDKDGLYYFDHSYHMSCPSELVAARCTYAGEVTAAIDDGRIFATQFHPEKSQVAGLKLLRRFFERAGAQRMQPC